MNVLRSLWAVTKWCASCIGHFVLWSLWLLLAAILVLQIVVACSHELRVPTRIIRSFQDRLALAGLRVSFDSASFDPSGHVLIENFRLFSDSFDEPLATSNSVFVKIDPRSLLVGSLEAESLQLHGLTFYVPAMFSPSGRSEPVLDQAEAYVRPRDRQIEIEQFVARAGALSVNCHGTVQLVRSRAATRRQSKLTIAAAVGRYIGIAKQVALWQAKLSAFDRPALHIELAPDETRIARAAVTFTADEIDVSPRTLGFASKLRLRGSRLEIQSSLPLMLAPRNAVQSYLKLASIESYDGTVASGISLKLSGALQPSPFVFDSWELNGVANEFSSRGVTVVNPTLQVIPEAWPTLKGELSGRVADQTWSVQARGNIAQRSGHISTEGHISASLVSLVGRRIGRELESLLALDKPAEFFAEAEFSEGGKPERARGRLSVEKVVAHGVSLDRASAHFGYRNDQLEVNDIVLQQGENHARGRYLMDTQTLDYRFLLTGQLRPAGINGWFHEWWPRFWSHFDFSASPPRADVDVDGRWKDPHLTTIYIYVDATSPLVKRVPFDRLRTTLFIRPDFYDGVEFLATRGTGSVRGRFTRSVDLEKSGFRWMDFDVTGNLEVQETALVFGEQGTEIVAPFRFEHPPQLKIVGRLEGEASPGGEHQHVQIDVASSGAFHFFGFPLSDLSCHAAVEDHDIDVTGLHVRFAEGKAQGTAKVTGLGAARTLSFDASVEDTSLGEAIHVLEDFANKRRGEKPSEASRFQQRVASGRLDVRASARGLYNDPYSFEGAGSAELRGAELAEINLLGSLSEALRGNSLLGFTSWRLDTARTTFTLEKDRVNFPDLRITGPTARLDAYGAYRLDAKTVSFNAKFYPFEEGKTLLANAVGLFLTPISAALELKLQGDLAQPKWYFAYGPTSLLKKIAGDEPTPSPQSADEAKPPVPPPLLRRR